jgi:hypothetical protein
MHWENDVTKIIFTKEENEDPILTICSQHPVMEYEK